MFSSKNIRPEKKEIPGPFQKLTLRQMLTIFLNKMDGILEQHYNEFQFFIEPPMETFILFFILFPAEQTTKLALQPSMEPTFHTPLTPPQLLPPGSEPFTPNVVCVIIKHRSDVYNEHRDIERIGFRLFLASCSVFVRLNFCPAVTPPFNF